MVNSGGFQRVSAGGTATGTKLSAGTQNISSGGKASATEVFSGGKQNIYADGIASGTIVKSKWLCEYFIRRLCGEHHY
ncbi:hypothetical protein ACLBR5_31930 [Escherichia coli]